MCCKERLPWCPAPLGVPCYVSVLDSVTLKILTFVFLRLVVDLGMNKNLIHLH